MSVAKWDSAFIHAGPANSDLTGKLFYLMKMVTNGKIDIAGSAGELVLGPLIEEGKSGEQVSILIGGMGKVVLSGDVTTGTLIATYSDGSARAASTTQYAAGIALQDGHSGDIISYLVHAGYKV